ncbi:MAG: amidase [Planctomycetaceae bacterium]
MEAPESISRLRAAMMAGSLTSTVLVERCLARIEAADRDLRAWVSVDASGARADAARADDRLARNVVRGVLHGIPIGIKDIIDVAGTVTGAGSRFRMKSEPAAERDAALVTALRRAGAIIIGKTVTTQFACFDPPPTRNPWAADRTPGGSSSGSAAAVAAGMVPAAIGSQTGGSITRPASYCGVCGMKPTFQFVSLDGVVPVASSLDHPGPIAGTVGDLRIVLQALTQSAAVESQLPAMSRLKLGRLRGFFEDRVDPGLREAMEATIDRFASAGAMIVDIDVPGEFSDVLVHHRRIMATEAATWHRVRFHEHRDDYSPCVASLIDDGLQTSFENYSASKAHQLALTAAMAAQFQNSIDALLTPATTGPAPAAATTGDPCMNSPWSYTGLPTVSFPIGLSTDRLPLAIQLAGPHQHDWPLLDVAEACERLIRPVP